MRLGAFALMFVLSSVVVAAQGIQITDENIPFLYESRAAVKAPEHKIASMISDDYRSAKDEFTRHDLMKQLRPVIVERLAEGKKTQAVIMLVNTKLGDYDFNKSVFPTGINGDTFLDHENGYAVKFTNADAASLLPVSVETARSLSGHLRDTRRAKLTIHGVITGAKEEKFNWALRKVLRVKITKIEIQHESGIPVGSKAL